MIIFALFGLSMHFASGLDTRVGYPIEEGVVKKIKAKATTWEPLEVAENPLSRLNYQELRLLTGTYLSYPMIEGDDPIVLENLPDNYDFRKEYLYCF